MFTRRDCRMVTPPHAHGPCLDNFRSLFIDFHKEKESKEYIYKEVVLFMSKTTLVSVGSCLMYQ